jgi:hypothetical protein
VEAAAPRLLKHFSEMQRAEARQRLEALAAAELDPVVRASLASAIAAVQDGGVK